MTLLNEERVSVVGESFYQPALLSITGASIGDEVRYECFAELIPEPSNDQDPNAVTIIIEGEKVGYLSRKDAVAFGPALTEMREAGQPTICDAFIGCLGAGNENPNLGVSLRINTDR